MAATEDGTLGKLVGEVDERARSGEDVSIGTIQETTGHGAAGPMLLLPALVVMSPLSILPGVPTLVGLNTVLVAGQIALGKKHIWLPKWLRNRTISSERAEKFLKFVKPVSRVADEVVKPRAQFLTKAPLRRIGAAVCVLVGCVLPMLEVIPFTSTWAGATVAVYALAITVRDGLLALAWVGLVAAVITVASIFLF